MLRNGRVGASLIAAGLAAAAALVPGRPSGRRPEEPCGSDAFARAQCVPDATRLWRYRGEFRLAHATSSFRVGVRLNSLGLRGPEVPSPDVGPAGGYRVLVIGGRNTFGWGVPERRRFTEQLAARLAPEYDGLVIVNAGYWSYGLDQQLLLLRQILPSVRPDLVVQAVTPRAAALLDRHDLDRDVDGRITAVRARGERVAAPGPRGPVAGSTWSLARSLVAETRREVEGSGARYMAAALPPAPGRGRSWPSDLEAALGLDAEHLLDLRGLLDESSSASLYVRDGTWSPEGHARVAAGLEEALRRQLEAIRFRRARADLVRIRELVIRLDPGLGRLAETGSASEVAAALRDFVYRRVPLRSPPKNLAFLPLFPAFRASVVDPRVGHLCAGIALNYVMALEAFGIRGRYVGMHAKPTPRADNHASVEYFDGERWIASDPTFNVAFADAGRPLGWLEVRERLLAARPVQISTGGRPVFQGRRIEQYYVPLGRLVAYMAIYTDIDGDGRLEPGEVVTAPADWDGSLRDGAKTTWRHSPNETYRMLGSHAP